MATTLTLTDVIEFTLGDHLRAAREKAIGGKIRTDDMAEKLNVSTVTIRNYESGRTHPNQATLREWARLTGYSLNAITDNGRLARNRCSSSTVQAALPFGPVAYRRASRGPGRNPASPRRRAA